jgi:hypothetical protein
MHAIISIVGHSWGDESLVRLLRDNKQAVMDAILAAEAESDRWRRILAEKVETIIRIRGLTRPDAEREAFQRVVVEFFELDAPEHRSEPLRPLRRLRDARRFSLAIRDARSPLHLVARNRCWAAWREARRKAADEALAEVGVAEPGRGRG